MVGAGRTTACGFPQASMGPKIPARSCVAGFEPQIQDDGPDSEFGQQHTSLQYTRVDSALSVSILGETLSVNDPLGETSVDPVWLCRVTGANTSGALFPARPLCASLERRHKPGWAVSGVAGTDGRGLCRRAHSLTAGAVAQAEPDIRLCERTHHLRHRKSQDSPEKTKV